MLFNFGFCCLLSASVVVVFAAVVFTAFVVAVLVVAVIVAFINCGSIEIVIPDLALIL